MGHEGQAKTPAGRSGKADRATRSRSRKAAPGNRSGALLRLQRTAGNTAVAGLFSAKASATGAMPNGSFGLVAQRAPGDLSDSDLLLSVMLRGTSLSWVFPIDELDRAAVDNLRADRARIAAIETQILAALNDDAGPVYEGQTYLQSPPVADDLRADVNKWPATRALPRFSGRIATRAAARRNTRLRYPLESSLVASGTLWPGDIDWKQEVAALRGHSPGPNKTLIDASRTDRFELALTILDREAAGGPPAPPGLTPHPELLGPIIYAKYAATDPAPSELATDEMTRTHSEAFVAAWLPTIRDTRFLPDDFDLSAFEPTDKLDALRTELVRRYVDEAAPRTMEKFLLDRWVADGMGRSPEQFVQTADISRLRGDLLDHLAKDFPRWAVTQPGFRGAFWSDVGQRAAYAALKTLVVAGRALQAFHAGLGTRFATVGAESLDPQEWAIAQDPYGYSQRIAGVATVTMGLVQHLKPGDLLEKGLQSWYEAIAAAWSPAGEDARPVAGLLAVFQALGGLKSAIESQRAASRTQIRKQLDTSYDKIAGIIRNEARAAEEFISKKWIPMLKAVALEQITKNRDEMKGHLANWEKYRTESAAKFRICAHVLSDLITRLESGDVDAIELDGQDLTKAHLPELTKTRDFMQGQADIMSNPEDAQEKKNDMQEALEGFEDVRKKIRSGEHKPHEYTKAVYQEARHRLGIAGYEDWTTMGMALDRWVIVPENPFLAYAIARWQWEERVKEIDKQFKIFLALGLLTIASLVVPGAAGVVLAGVDVAVGLATGISHVVDAYALLDLAKLDPNASVRGVTVEQARAALKTAWIGLGLNIILIGGLGALWVRLILKGRAASKIPTGLEHLAALAKTNPVAAEQLMAKVKDLTKLDELLSTTGDAMLLQRMLDKTSDIRHLEFALMHGKPEKIAELLELAGDASKLGKVLDQVPDLVAAERLLKLTDDAEGLALLLRSADNHHIAEALLKWTNPRLADQMIGIAGDQAGLLKLSRSGLSPETAVRVLPKTESAEQLAALVARMDKGPEQVAVLLETRTGKELEGLLNRGIRPSEVEMGLGTPRIGPQPEFAIAKVPVPDDVRKILQDWGIADLDMFKLVAPHELRRLSKLNTNKLSDKIDRAVNKKAIEWAANGAKGPGDFVDRWEFLKRSLKETKDGLDRTKFPGQNLDNVAAAQLTADAGIAKMNAELQTRADTLRNLAGLGWADIGATAEAAAVRTNATKLTFGSEVSGPYHVDKHLAELALAERPPPGADFAARTSAYVASARRTVAEGTLVDTIVRDGATTFVYSRTVRIAGDQTVVLDTLVIARDRWALIASHGKSMR